MQPAPALVPDFSATDPGMTIAQHWSHRAASDPDHPYCRFAEETWTIGRMNALSNRVAHMFGTLCPVGSRVAVMLKNHPDHVATIFGLIKAGMVRIPVNVHLKGAALAFLFERFEPRVLIAEREFEPVLASILAEHPDVTVFWRDTDGGHFAKHLSRMPDTDSGIETASDQVLAITPSSGTTGEPKGVLKTDQSLRSGPLGIFALTGASRGDVLLHWEPLYHGAGVAVLIAAVMRPLTLAMVPRFSASQFWDQVALHGVTLVHYLGGILPILLAQPEREGEHEHGVRLAWGGGASIEVSKRFTQRFALPVREGYGLSEMTTFVTVSGETSPAGSCGKPLAFYEVRLRPLEGTSETDLGELQVRPLDPGLAFQGYYGRPESVDELVHDGWFSTGDLLRRDSGANYYYAGRLKDSVRRRGVNISAWEVERVFQGHPAVEECALVGVESAVGDEDLKLFVKRTPGSAVDAGELIGWARDNMPYFQVPRYLSFVDSFEKTPTQRIVKASLSRSPASDYDDEEHAGRPTR